VLGSGTRSLCADGTAALARDLDPVDLFVDARGRMTFVDVDFENTASRTRAHALSLGAATHP